MGLAWDVTNGVNIDLDASCVFLDKAFQVVDQVWFRQLRSKDGAMVHQGDEREGDEAGDDESIKVHVWHNLNLLV
jgi:tellurium resistance protein TerZ